MIESDNDNGASITLPLSVYEEMYKDQVGLRALRERGLVDDQNELGLFTHDPEVAVFIAARYQVMTASEVSREAALMFGYERQPTAPAVKRFWLRFSECLDIEG